MDVGKQPIVQSGLPEIFKIDFRTDLIDNPLLYMTDGMQKFKRSDDFFYGWR
jgi:hypothetical protein